MKEMAKKTSVVAAEQKLRTYIRTKEAITIMEEKLQKLREAEEICRKNPVCAAERARIRTECRRLQALIGLNRIETEAVEQALERLNREERRVLDTMLIAPVPEAADRLCSALNVETATVYRRRRAALEKLTAYLP